MQVTSRCGRLASARLPGYRSRSPPSTSASHEPDTHPARAHRDDHQQRSPRVTPRNSRISDQSRRVALARSNAGARGYSSSGGARGAPPLAIGLVGALAGLKLLTHLLVILFTPYGIHRDSFLYMAMGRHLRFWSMDFPPGIALLSNAARAVFGDTLFAVLIFPALAGTALVVLAALIARELGGGRMAQGLAALAVLASPLFLRSASLFQPVVLDQLWWTLALLAVVRIARGAGAGSWVLLGVACGLGLLTKFSIVLLAVPLAVALLLTPLRRAYLTRWPWAALAIALVLGSPSIAGQVRLGYPLREQMRVLQSAQLERVTPAAFAAEQLLYGPGTLLALAGLVALLFWPRLRPFRAVGWTAVGVLIVLLALRGKGYYFGPMYPALYAAGAVGLAALPGRGAPRLAGVAVVLMVAYMCITLPLGLPILRPPEMARYSRALGVTTVVQTNRGEVGELPQDYADMLGWKEQVRAVAAAYHALSPEEQADAVVLADNYGEAGAIDFYGPRYGLPPAICPSGSYWFFGPGPKPGNVLLSLGPEPEALREHYATVRLVGRFDHPWMVSEERQRAIVVSTDPHRTLQQLWPTIAGRN